MKSKTDWKALAISFVASTILLSSILYGGRVVRSGEFFDPFSSESRAKNYRKIMDREREEASITCYLVHMVWQTSIKMELWISLRGLMFIEEYKTRNHMGIWMLEEDSQLVNLKMQSNLIVKKEIDSCYLIHKFL